jgi:hypothetical protein
MRQETSAEIRRLSRKLRLLVLLIGLTAGSVLVYCAWRLSFDLEGFQHDVGQALFSDPKPMTLTPIAITGLIVIGLANAALAFGGLHAVWSLFGRYQIGDLFSRQCGKLLRRAGMFALAGAVSGIVSRTAGVLLVTYANPAGQKMLAIGVSSTEVLLFLLSGLLFVLGHIMIVAEELEADYRSFV